MAALDQTFLQQLGINLDDQTFEAFSEHFEASLNERVIEEIVETLTPEQMEQLSALNGRDDAMQTWLQANVPDLTDIIQDEIDILLGELAENADSI